MEMQNLVQRCWYIGVKEYIYLSFSAIYLYSLSVLTEVLFSKFSPTQKLNYSLYSLNGTVSSNLCQAVWLELALNLKLPSTLSVTLLEGRKTTSRLAHTLLILNVIDWEIALALLSLLLNVECHTHHSVISKTEQNMFVRHLPFV